MAAHTVTLRRSATNQTNLVNVVAGPSVQTDGHLTARTIRPIPAGAESANDGNPRTAGVGTRYERNVDGGIIRVIKRGTLQVEMTEQGLV